MTSGHGFSRTTGKGDPAGPRGGHGPARAEAEQALTEKELQRLHSQYRLGLSEQIERCLKQLADRFPGFRFETIVDDRGWGAAISRDDLRIQAGQRSSCFSRLEMVVRPISAFFVLELAAKATVCNRELFRRTHYQRLGEVSPTALDEMIDLWALEYAERYATRMVKDEGSRMKDEGRGTDRSGHPSSFILHPLLLDHYRKRRTTWHDLSRYAPANGPICPWKSWRECSEFGYDGLELACWGDHFEVDKALAEADYCSKKHALLERHGMSVFAVSAHLVGQAVLDNIDARHQAILPPAVWGDGDPAGVNARAAEEMKNTARAAQKFGVSVVNGFTGSSIWHLLYSFPPVPPVMIDDGFKLFAERWNPILDVFGECGVKFALEVHPTEIAFDIVTTQRAIDAAGRPRGVRLQLRSEPPALAGRRSGGIHPRLPGPDLSRSHEGRHRDAQRAERHLGEPPELRRSAPRLGLPLLGPGRHQFRGDRPRPERGRLSRPVVGRMGRQRHGPRARRKEALEFVRKLDFEPSRVAFDAAFDKEERA